MKAILERPMDTDDLRSASGDLVSTSDASHPTWVRRCPHSNHELRRPTLEVPEPCPCGTWTWD